MRNLLVLEDEVRLVPDDWKRTFKCIHDVDLADCCCLDCRAAACDIELPESLEFCAIPQSVSKRSNLADLLVATAATQSDGWPA
jgi:hypothetical protein